MVRRPFLRWTIVCHACLLFLGAAGLFAHDDGGKGLGESAKPGIGGNGPFNHLRIRLISHMPLTAIGGGGPDTVLGNDIWGWTDPGTGREYAIYGMSNGTSFIDITDPWNPTYLGKLPTHTGNSAWRDLKVCANHAYIVADNNGDHGLQIFDLTQLGSVVGPPVTFSETAHYAGFTYAHNIAINEASGFAYVVGSNQASKGLYMLDLSNPTSPTLAGTFGADGYTHDAQVVNYIGPDPDYAGREIAFASNEDTVTIVDVSNKALPVQISRSSYPDAGYVHQGWLTEDHRYFIQNDELDEKNLPGIQTRTHIWDVSDLDNPSYVGFYQGVEATIDHNLYIKDGLIFQGNYTSGLRVLEMTDLANGVLTEIGFFDTYPTDNNVSYNGVWSVFPYFGSGMIIINDRQNGLFIVQMVPEPAAGALLALGLAGAWFLGRRRRPPQRREGCQR